MIYPKTSKSCSCTSKAQTSTFGNGSAKVRIGAHKNLLAARSKMFMAIFYGKLKIASELAIAGGSAAVFKEFLQFFYLHRIHLTVKNVEGVMNLGDKYQVAYCMDVCSKFIRDSLSVVLVCPALELAILYNRCNLLFSCELIIELNTKQVFASSNFLECNRKVIAVLH